MYLYDWIDYALIFQYYVVHYLLLAVHHIIVLSYVYSGADQALHFSILM
jgi:hypothetical protein